MKKIDAILQYIEKQDISIASFEREFDIGNGYLKKTKDKNVDISNKILDRIRKSPEVYNAIFGEVAESIAQPPKEDVGRKYVELLERIADDGEKIKALEKRLERMESLIIANQRMITEAAKGLGEAKQNQLVTYSILIAFQEYFVDEVAALFPGGTPAEVAKQRISQAAWSALAKSEKEGMTVG